MIEDNPELPFNQFWVRSMPQPPKQINLVHGEPNARKAMARALGTAYRR